MVLSLQRENLKVIVVAAGISLIIKIIKASKKIYYSIGVLYGYGEVAFKNHFKSAWLQDPKELPYLGDG